MPGSGTDEEGGSTGRAIGSGEDMGGEAALRDFEREVLEAADLLQVEGLLKHSPEVFRVGLRVGRRLRGWCGRTWQGRRRRGRSRRTTSCARGARFRCGFRC